MDNQFEPLNNDEVLFINVGRVLMVNPTFKVGEFIDALAQAISDRENDWSDENEGWFGEGLPCEALRFGNPGWQRGRVRIRLEFVPETNKPKMLDVPRDKPRRAEKPNPKIDDVYSDDLDEDY